MDMLYRYKNAFSLTNETGTCPKVEFEIDVDDKTPFFIRPHHVKEEDRHILDREMKRLLHVGTLKEGFSAYSSSLMLLSRKPRKEKRHVSDFRHINSRIAKTIWLFPW